MCALARRAVVAKFRSWPKLFPGRALVAAWVTGHCGFHGANLRSDTTIKSDDRVCWRTKNREKERCILICTPRTHLVSRQLMRDRDWRDADKMRMQRARKSFPSSSSATHAASCTRPAAAATISKKRSTNACEQSDPKCKTRTEPPREPSETRLRRRRKSWDFELRERPAFGSPFDEHQ